MFYVIFVLDLLGIFYYKKKYNSFFVIGQIKNRQKAIKEIKTISVESSNKKGLNYSDFVFTDRNQ